MPLTEDRNTYYIDGELVDVPVAAAVEIFAGALVVLSGGYLAPGSEALNLVAWGRAEEHVDNSGGAAGDKTCRVRRKKAFKWANSGADPVAQADVGATVYIEDDETISKTDNTGARSAAGTLIQVDSDGAWVEA